MKETMINPPIDRLLDKVDNKYVLAMLVSKRSRELYGGEEKIISDDYVNIVTLATNEIDQDKIGYYLIEEGDRINEVHTDVSMNDLINSSL